MSDFLKEYKSNISRLKKLLLKYCSVNGYFNDIIYIKMSDSFYGAKDLYFIKVKPKIDAFEENGNVYFCIDLNNDIHLSLSCGTTLPSFIESFLRFDCDLRNKADRDLIEDIKNDLVLKGYLDADISDVSLFRELLNNQKLVFDTHAYAKMDKEIYNVEKFSQVHVTLKDDQFPKFSKREYFPILILDTNTLKTSFFNTKQYHSSYYSYRKNRGNLPLNSLEASDIKIIMGNVVIKNFCKIDILYDKSDAISKGRFWWG